MMNLLGAAALVAVLFLTGCNGSDSETSENRSEPDSQMQPPLDIPR